MQESFDAAHQKTLFGLRWILIELCKKHGFDIVLLDMGPNTSKLNRMLLHTADAVIPSFRPDYYGWASYVHLVLDGECFSVCLIPA